MSLIDFNLTDTMDFIPSSRYCLIGIVLPAVVSFVDFRFSLGILVQKLDNFALDTAMSYKCFFPFSFEML